MPQPDNNTMASPCISVCRMDARSGLCAGCWRTLDEIATWSTLSDGDKRGVWALIEQRRVTHPTFAEPTAP